MSLAHIQVNVSQEENFGQEVLKIIWNYQNVPALPYFVSATILKDRGEEVRHALQRLVDRGMKHEKGLEGCGKELREVAAAGYQLYEALFQPIDDYDAENIRSWLRQESAAQQALGNRCQMTFIVESVSHIPWGLVYDGSLERLTDDPAQDSLQDYEDFWCLKFMLCSNYRRMLAHWQPISSSTDVREVLSVINKSAFEKASPHLVLPQEDMLEWFQTSFGLPVSTSSEFYERWKESAARYRLLHFYCHAGPESLVLDLNDLIKLTDFRQRTRPPDSKQRSTCLVFLNGCNTAVGDADGAFLISTGEFLFCGFVGTEAKVPDVFALRFGLAFLYCFLHEGWPIYKTMDHLRRQHWPLGLLYSSYCSPFLSFTPLEQPLRITINDNFSRLPLGTQSM